MNNLLEVQPEINMYELVTTYPPVKRTFLKTQKHQIQKRIEMVEDALVRKSLSGNSHEHTTLNEKIISDYFTVIQMI